MESTIMVILAIIFIFAWALSPDDSGIDYDNLRNKMIEELKKSVDKH